MTDMNEDEMRTLKAISDADQMLAMLTIKAHTHFNQMTNEQIVDQLLDLREELKDRPLMWCYLMIGALTTGVKVLENG